MDLRTIDTIRTVRIRKVIQESSNIRSLLFKDNFSVNAEPGQFLMVWVPAVGEFPMSASLRYGKEISSIVVKGVGEGTRKLYDSRIGDIIGLRGPYGRPFTFAKRMTQVLLVGGGTGMAPVVLAARALRELGVQTRLVIGAKTKDELPFLDFCRRTVGARKVYLTTDDGSLGRKGLAHEEVIDLVSKFKFDCMFACGPEAMMYHIFRIAYRRSIPVQFSLERIMKCGFSICGSCCMGDVILCRDGPVLNSKTLSELGSEFGFLERDKTGRLVQKTQPFGRTRKTL